MIEEHCTFYIVRHAQSEANANKILGGNFPLTQLGEEQARALSTDLASVEFEHVYASDLVRAKKTAEILSMERDIAVRTSKFLRERHFGRLDGKLLAEIQDELTAWTKQAEAATKEQSYHRGDPNGVENDDSLIGRYFTFLREVAVVNPGKNILIVSHSNVMRTLLVHLGFAKASELGRGSIENTGYVILTSDGIDFFVKDAVGIHKKSV